MFILTVFPLYRSSSTTSYGTTSSWPFRFLLGPPAPGPKSKPKVAPVPPKNCANRSSAFMPLGPAPPGPVKPAIPYESYTSLVLGSLRISYLTKYEMGVKYNNGKTGDKRGGHFLELLRCLRVIW